MLFIARRACIKHCVCLANPPLSLPPLSQQDEVRALGRLLGVPEQFIARHPFPGPGLAVRIIGDVTGEGGGGWRCEAYRLRGRAVWVVMAVWGRTGVRLCGCGGAAAA